jgi:DNA-binding response OmpR family regulator
VVLVVDDTTVPRVLVSDMLRQAGMEVLETDAGEAALKIAVERRPLGSDTLLVLDRRLCLPES